MFEKTQIFSVINKDQMNLPLKEDTIIVEISQKIQDHIQQNKDILVKTLLLCNFTHNLCFFMLELLQYYNFKDIYKNQLDENRDYKQINLLFNSFFQVPINFVLPVLMGYARDFVNQVITIRISFFIIIIGMIFQYLAMIQGQMQFTLIGIFMFMLGKEIFFVAGLCLIIEYFPINQEFSIKQSLYSQYGWCLPRMVANLLLIIIDSSSEINQFIMNQKGFYFFNSIMFLVFEYFFIHQILKTYKILEQHQENDSYHYKNPFRKHNIFITIQKYLTNIDIMQTIVISSLVIGIENTQFMTYFNTTITNFIQQKVQSTPDSSSFLLSLFQSSGDFIGCHLIAKSFQKEYSFSKIIQCFQLSCLLSIANYMLFTLTSFSKEPKILALIIFSLINIVSGISLSLIYFSSYNIILKFQYDNMIGTLFGLTSSFVMVSWTVGVFFAIFYSVDENICQIISLVGLIISLMAFLWSYIFGNKILKDHEKYTVEIQLQELQ